MDIISRYSNIFSAALLGLALYSGVAVLGKALSRKSYVEVKGIGEREVKSDLAIWTIGFSTTQENLSIAESVIEEQKNKILEFLKKIGFKDEEIKSLDFDIQETPKTQNDKTKSSEDSKPQFKLNYILKIRSSDVDKVKNGKEKMVELIREKILINSSIKYVFTKFNEIRPEMIGDAIRNARKAADQFAKDSNTQVGAIKSANQGVFSITGADKTGIDSWDYDESQSLYKNIRVVSTVNFYMEN